MQRCGLSASKARFPRDQWIGATGRRNCVLIVVNFPIAEISISSSSWPFWSCSVDSDELA